MGAPSDPLPTDPDWAGGTLYRDERQVTTAAPAEAVWRVVEGIGGHHGWYSLPLAWQARGLVDRLVGGVGLRRGRRHPDRLLVGESLDFWRVEEVVPGRLLRLRAEMRLPGHAWLEFTVDELQEGRQLKQRALFSPRGLAGHLYWWSVAPFHAVVFAAMARNLVAAALADDPPRVNATMVG